MYEICRKYPYSGRTNSDFRKFLNTYNDNYISSAKKRSQKKLNIFEFN